MGLEKLHELKMICALTKLIKLLAESTVSPCEIQMLNRLISRYKFYSEMIGPPLNAKCRTCNIKEAVEHFNCQTFENIRPLTFFKTRTLINYQFQHIANLNPAFFCPREMFVTFFS